MTTRSRNCDRSLCRQLVRGVAACLVFRTALLLTTLLGMPEGSAAQLKTVPDRRPVKQVPAKGATLSAPPAQNELEKRLGAVSVAKELGDIPVIAAQSKLLLALGLREMAKLRMLETAFSQAAELYRQSLSFEDVADAHVDMAIAYLYGNRADDSLVEVRKALAADPKNPESWNVQGEALLKKKDYGRAAESLEKAFAMRPDLESAYALGICYLNLKQNEKAAEMFRRIKAAMGDSVGLHMMLGQAYWNARFPEEAKGEFRNALALDPKVPNAHYMLGLIDLKQNEWAPTASSREEFLKELQFHPQSFSANYLLGFMASNAKNLEESDHFLKIAAQLMPSSVEAWLYLGLNAYQRKENARAGELFRKAIALAEKDNPDGHDEIRKAYLSLGRILISAGRKEEGQGFVEKARAVEQRIAAESQKGVEGVAGSAGAGGSSGSAPAQKNEDASFAGAMRGNAAAPVEAAALGRAQFSASQKKAAEAQEHSLRLVLGSAFNDLATAEAMQEQYRDALGNYQQAERWDPKFPHVLRNLGFAAFRAGDNRETIRALAQELKADPNEDAVRSVLGLAYFGNQAYAEAVRTLAPLGDGAKQDPDLGYAWAASLARYGDAKQAADILEALEGAQVPVDTLVLTGQLWHSLGNTTRAVAAFERAIELNPSLAAAHYQLGKVLLVAGDAKAAITHLEKAVGLSPESEEMHSELEAAYRQEGRAAEADRELQIGRKLKRRNSPPEPPAQKDQR